MPSSSSGSFPHLPGLSQGCCLYIRRTGCIAVSTESILPLFIYKKVRYFELAASGTEQKQPCVPVTCPSRAQWADVVLPASAVSGPASGRTCLCSGLVCGAGLVWCREGGLRAVSLQLPLSSNKFLHSWIPCCPLFLLFASRVSGPAVTP